ncbi:CgeB family protein [Marinivivus vitaminiproducens]|uniref:CgeB family protein n=1 Tax=Marinivivus vitaminiproducens TaxID=3035935 RepID=UPI0027A6EF16|nr:glycosyltransferase [Geminicoccaceae bacterium SCSIO 64248]
MRIAFYGSSLVSSYWNGAATYYRGLLRALSNHGHDITFYEPDAFDRQAHRDIEPPDWCRVVVYEATAAGLNKAVAQAAHADVVIKTSGVGFADDALLQGLMATARPNAVTGFCDVDAPATLGDLAANPAHPLRQALPALDMVLTYGGGDPVVEAYRAFGARKCVPIYNALDPDSHHPVPVQDRFRADLAFLGNRLPDREERVDRFFLDPARRVPDAVFRLGGSGWSDKSVPTNVRVMGHVPTADHNAFNVSAKAVLNVCRASMADNGFSPATRVFEVAGAGACLVTDAWVGIDLFLRPDQEVLVVRDGQDVVEVVQSLTPARATAIGRRALARVLAEHTYDRRAAIVDRLLRRDAEQKAVRGRVA